MAANYLENALLMVGAIICYRRIHSAGIYRYGLWFFALTGVSRLSTWLIKFTMRTPALYAEELRVLGLMTLPGQMAGLAGYVLLLVGSYRCHRINRPQTICCNEEVPSP